MKLEKIVMDLRDLRDLRDRIHIRIEYRPVIGEDEEEEVEEEKQEDISHLQPLLANTKAIMAAVVYLVLGFLLLVSKHNEVAMSRRHERRPGGPIQYSRYISRSSSFFAYFQDLSRHHEFF
jgi:hypothetical protein